MSESKRKSCIKFLKAIGFKLGSKIWIRASWNYPDIPAPYRWKTYLREDKKFYCQYIFCGEITNFGFALTRCCYGGRDQTGNTIWQPTTKIYEDGF
ncbi:MAG: hypothetical protein ACRC78_08655, partial [Planktothrix sp.]